MLSILFLLFILRMLIRAYLLVMVIRMILDWLPVLIPSFRPTGIIAFITRIIYFVTEPPLRFLRKFIAPMRCGNISLDISYMVLYFALYVLQILL